MNENKYKSQSTGVAVGGYPVSGSLTVEKEFAGIALKGARPLLETVGMTAERLQSIEQRLFKLEGLLFGSSPAEDQLCRPSDMPTVSSCALDAFGTSVRIQQFLDELIQRIEP